jgi:hypothetical protein
MSHAKISVGVLLGLLTLLAVPASARPARALKQVCALLSYSPWRHDNIHDLGRDCGAGGGLILVSPTLDLTRALIHTHPRPLYSSTHTHTPASPLAPTLLLTPPPSPSPPSPQQDSSSAVETSNCSDVALYFVQTASYGKMVATVQPDGNVSLVIRMEVVSDMTNW